MNSKISFLSLFCNLLLIFNKNSFHSKNVSGIPYSYLILGGSKILILLSPKRSKLESISFF